MGMSLGDSSLVANWRQVRVAIGAALDQRRVGYRMLAGTSRRRSNPSGGAAMNEFPKCLLIVTAEIDPAVEADWNRWYDTVHLPDALRCPGVRRGRRYVSSGEISESAAGKTERTKRRIYTTIYELDSPDAITTPEFRAMRGWYQFAPHVRLRTQVIVPVQG